MAYINKERNSRLRKRQGGSSGNTNVQPFPNGPPNPTNTIQNKNSGGIDKFQLIGIIAGVLILLGFLIGIIIRRKMNRERTRNAIRISITEWDNDRLPSMEKPSGTIRPLQTINPYNERDVEEDKFSSSIVIRDDDRDFVGRKSPPSFVEKSPSIFVDDYSPSLQNNSKLSNFKNVLKKRDQNNLDMHITSPLDPVMIRPKIKPTDLNFKPLNSPNSYDDSPKQQRFQLPSNGSYRNLPNSPRSPLIFKNKPVNTDTDDDDTYSLPPRSPLFNESTYSREHSPHSPLFNKGTYSREHSPRSPLFSNSGPVPKNGQNSYPVPTKNQDSYQNELYEPLPLVSPTVNKNKNKKNNNNNHEENGDNISHTSMSINEKCEIIMKLDSDLDDIITKFKQAGEEDNPSKRYRYTNYPPPSPSKNDDVPSLPKLPKESLKSISSTSTNEESNEPHSQENSIYSESRTSSIGINDMNQNVQMDYVSPIQGMIQIEKLDEHKITKNNVPKESIKMNDKVKQEAETDSSQLIQQSNMVIKQVNNKPQIVDNFSGSQTTPSDTVSNEPISNKSSQTSAPTMTGMNRSETLASKPVVAPKSAGGTLPMYDIDSIKRHAEKVLGSKTKKEGAIEDKDTKGTLGSSNTNTGKSILVNKDNKNAIKQTLTPESANGSRRGSALSTSSYQMYDFDISSYQDNTDSVDI